MRTIGLLGGMSWESSAEYYRLLNRGVRDVLGPTASARCILWSFDFSEIERLQHRGDWDGLRAMLVDAARRLEAAGSDMLLICTNTMHRLAPDIESAVQIPLLHIADPTGESIRQAGLTTVGLLGTAFTMEQDFYKGRLADRYGLSVIIPPDEDRVEVHRIIYDELVTGTINPSARASVRGIMERMAEEGAEGVILGCTELMLLVRPEDSPVPTFDTTSLHVTAAIERALEPRRPR